MKKIAFTLQVFGTIALFPIYVILEMNHGIEKLPGNKKHTVVKEKAEKTVIQAPLNDEAQNEMSIPGKLFTGPEGPVCKNELIKVLTPAAYKAY
jgi:hypothetical protein